MKHIAIHEQQAVPIERVSFSRKRELRASVQFVPSSQPVCWFRWKILLRGEAEGGGEKIEPH